MSTVKKKKIIWIRYKTVLGALLCMISLGLAVVAEPDWKRFWCEMSGFMFAYMLGSVGE